MNNHQVPEEEPTSDPQITPLPIKVRRLHGAPFELRENSRICVARTAAWVGEELALILRASTGYELPLIDGNPQPGDISFSLNEGTCKAEQQEAYIVSVQADSIRIGARSAAGLFNGMQSLRQLFPPQVESNTAVSGPWIINPVRIEDAPRFAYRGILLDVARSFYNVQDVKAQIDVMAAFKFNALHLHLTDDQAWRLHLENPENNPSGLDYEALSRIGGKGAVDAPNMGLGPGDTGFFTREDYTEIVRYAGRKNIVVVPELDLPGHVNAALAAIPELSPDGRAKPMNATGDVGYSTLSADHPVVYEFVAEALRQFAEITPGPYLHIGGDEALVTGHGNYVLMMNRFSRMVRDLGKYAIGWNEIAVADVPPGSILQYWSGALEALTQQVRDNSAKVIMSPAEHTYLDQKYKESSPVGQTRMGTGDWERFYDWNPVMPELLESDVLGVEAALWTETVRGNDQAFWMSYPRAIAVAEVAWSEQQRRSREDFARRLPRVGKRLDIQGVPFYRSPSVEWAPDTNDALAQFQATRR